MRTRPLTPKQLRKILPFRGTIYQADADPVAHPPVKRGRRKPAVELREEVEYVDG
jgi:hypothetical protein